LFFEILTFGPVKSKGGHPAASLKTGK